MERFRTPEFWLKFAAYALPIGFLLYVLYWNFLPFGYNETFTIQVGSASDTSGQFRLEPSRDLSERKTAPDGSTYRELNGLAFAVFEPKAVLKNATVTVSVEGDGVSLTPLQLDFDPASVKWDNSWDFTQNIPSILKGTAFEFDNRAYFDGAGRLELPYSYNQFESGPFSVYAKWKPEDSTDDFQEIIGHYNWELLQESDGVRFRVGRMNNNQGPTYSIKYPVEPDFFSQKHSALAIYAPAANNGYIDLYVDGNYAGRTYIGTDKIYGPYNGSKNLTFGKSDHGIAEYFKGYIYEASFYHGNILPPLNHISFSVNSPTGDIRIPILTGSASPIKKLIFNVK